MQRFNYWFVRIIIYMAMKNAKISQFGEFSHRRIVLKKTTPHQKKKQKKKKKAMGEKARKRGMWWMGNRAVLCVWFKLWLSLAKYALRMGCALLDAISHTIPPFSLSPRAQDKTSSVHLTSPQIRFLSFYPVLAPAKNRGVRGKWNADSFELIWQIDANL